MKRTISLLRHVSPCICLVQIMLNRSRFFFAFEELLLCCGFHYHSFYAIGVRSRRHSWCVRSWLFIFYFKSFVALLYLHCCMTLVYDVALVLDYVACAVGVFQSLCFVCSFIR